MPGIVPVDRAHAREQPEARRARGGLCDDPLDLPDLTSMAVVSEADEPLRYKSLFRKGF